MTSRTSLGAFGERSAREFLEQRGYKVLEQNVRMRSGEIDLVAKEGESLVIVEVRTKGSRRFGTPEESITATKLRKLMLLGEEYLQARKQSGAAWRIDIVAVEVGGDGQIQRLELLRDVTA